MTADMFGRSAEFHEGPNQQDRTVWDLRPDSGEHPRKIRMSAGHAGEAIERDPDRYAYWFPEHGDTPPQPPART